MKNLGQLFLRYWDLSALFAVFILIYLLLAANPIATSAALDRYNISLTELQLINLLIAVPYVIIWVVGLAGYLHLYSYTRYLDSGKDATGFRRLTNGVFLLVLWLPISTLFNHVTTRYYTDNPEATASLVRADSYVNLLILFAGFYLIYTGVKKLLTITGRQVTGLTPRQTFFFIAFSAVYTFLTYSDPARSIAPDAATPAMYYMPDWLILIGVVIPRLCMWYLGFLAVAGMLLYGEKVKGAIYKKGLRNVSLGVAGVLIATITLRVVQSLTTSVNQLSLMLVLLLVYFLLALIGLGYVLIARGARSLQRIEES